MLQLSSTVLNRNVLSLRSGSVIASITGPIINPNNLKIEGFYCEDRYSHDELILLVQDIRDVVQKGYVVNDHDALVEANELVRLKDILELGYDPIGKQVVTLNKEKVGKISDYAIETDSMYIQKLYASQSIFKSLAGGSLSIDRSLVQEITPRQIIISELMEPASARAVATAN